LSFYLIFLVTLKGKFEHASNKFIELLRSCEKDLRKISKKAKAFWIRNEEPLKTYPLFGKIGLGVSHEIPTPCNADEESSS